MRTRCGTAQSGRSLAPTKLLGGAQIAAAALGRKAVSEPQRFLRPVAWSSRVHYFKNETVGRAAERRAIVERSQDTWERAAKADNR
jgi:hypothetical protein